MRKKLVVIAGLSLMTITIFSGCDSEKRNLIENTTAHYHVHTDDNGETYTHLNEEEHKEEQNNKSNDNNKEIDSTEAIEIIKKFSIEKLELEGQKKDYSFMVATEKKTIEDKEYFEVIASVKKENEKDGTVSIDTKGTYYVSVDGKKCLVKNMKTGETKELK